MTTLLADYRTRLLNVLGDPSGNRYAVTQQDDAIRTALAEYSNANPDIKNLTFTAAAAGKDQIITGTSNLFQVIYVQYPTDLDPTLNVVQAWYFNNMGGVPTLHFVFNQPQVGEQIDLAYTAAHTITNLDTAAATTVPPVHDALLCLGAAAHAAIARSTQITEQMTQRASNSPQLAAWGQARLAEFRVSLDLLSKSRSKIFFPNRGWALDQWDKKPTGRDLPFI